MSPQGGLRNPGGSRLAEVDNGEVTFHRGRGWGPGKPAQQCAGPPWADTDFNHLLSMLTARLRMGTPRINIFSGDATPRKTKVCFEQWYHEVKCIKDHYPEAVV